MEDYVRFSNSSTSPQPSRANSARYPYGADSESGSDPPTPVLAPLREETVSWFPSVFHSAWRRLHPPTPTPYQSQYLTLIPLSDARLRPRRTKLIVSSLLLLAVTAVVCVFLMVPRGVSVGSIDVHSTKMTFNSTTLTYRIILQADVPVFNPNYLKASVVGNVSVSFFDAEAGWSAVGPVSLAARTQPNVISVKVDASNLPRKYTQVVYTHCFNFPRKLIFFLMANFQATYLGYTTKLPDIDTYFMLDCSGAKELTGLPAAQGPADESTASPIHQQQQEQQGLHHQRQQWTLQQRTQHAQVGSTEGLVSAQDTGNAVVTAVPTGSLMYDL